MSAKISVSLALVPTTLARRDGAAASRLSHFLKPLEADITELLTDWSRFAPRDAPSFQLSIIANVTGEQETNESLTSIMQPGASSPTNHSAEDSSKSPSDQSMEQGHWTEEEERRHRGAVLQEGRRLVRERTQAATQAEPSSPTPRSQWDSEHYRKFAEVMREAMDQDPSLTDFGAGYIAHLSMDQPRSGGLSRAGGEWHEFEAKEEDIPWRDGNCNRCGMPRNAWQHEKAGQ